MKRLWSVLLVVCLTVSMMVGCGGQKVETKPETEVKSDVQLLYSNDSGDNYTVSTIPCSMEYNGKEIILDEAKVYESSSEHGYHVYASLGIDLKNLSEDDIYWLDNEEDLSANIYMSDDKNGIDFKRLNSLGSYDDGSRRIYMYYYLDEIHYELTNAEFSVDLSIKKSDTYEYKNDKGLTKTANKTDHYAYYIKQKDGGKILSVSEMADTTAAKMNEAFENILGN